MIYDSPNARLQKLTELENRLVSAWSQVMDAMFKANDETRLKRIKDDISK